MSDAQQLSLLEVGATTTWATGSRVLLTQGQIAAAFGLAPSTISRWPLQPVERRGREVYYDLAEAIRYRIGELGRLDLQQERARLARVQSERQELQLARERGELLPADDVERVWSLYIATARARMLTLPEVAAPRVAGATVPAAVFILRDLVYEALTELAKYDPDAFQPAPPPPDATGGEVAPEFGDTPPPAKARGRRRKAKTKKARVDG